MDVDLQSGFGPRPFDSYVDPEGRRHAVVLTGGGARAAFEVGVLAALARGLSSGTGGWPLQTNILCGTSLGAYHAAFLACHQEKGRLAPAIDELTRIWRRQIARSSRWPDGGIYRLRGVPFYVEVPQSLARDPVRSLLDTLRATGFWTRFAWRRAVDLTSPRKSLLDRVQASIPVNEFFDIRPFRELVRETLDLKNLSRDDVFLAVTVTNFHSGSPEIHFKEQLVEDAGENIIFASAAVPGLVPAIYIKADPYVDGSLAMEVPFLPAMAANADVLHVVRSWRSNDYSPIERDASSFAITLRMIRMLMETNTYNKLHSLRYVAEEVEELIEEERRKWQDPDEFLTPCTFHRTRELLRRWAPRIPGSPSEIHFYSLKDSFRGTDGFLDFRAGRIDRLMSSGFRSARDHDCRAAGCWSAEHADRPGGAA